MAVVSNSDHHDSAASAMEPSAPAFNPDELAALHRNYLQQQQQHNHLFRAMGPMMMRPHGHVLRDVHQQHQFQYQSPMQLYQQLMAAGNEPQAFQSVGRGHVQPGFMSSFLLAEKERMAAAAMRIAQQANFAPQPMAAKLQSAAPQSQSLASASTSTSAVTLQPATAASSTDNNNNNSQQQTTKPAPITNPKQQQNNQSVANGGSGSSRQTPGGLMPNMMMPLSHMPDTMIGQAYNAAVGQALPSDTGTSIVAVYSTLRAPLH